MKNQLIACCLLLCATGVNAQSNNGQANGQGVTQWKTNGNITNSGDFFGTKNDQPVRFRSNDIERLRITSNGYVGIGTAAPQTKLDVDGDVTLRDAVYLPGLQQDNGLDNLLTIDPATGEIMRGDMSKIADLIYEDKGCPIGDILSPTWANGVNKIYTKCPQVNVGIGTDVPNYKLDVVGFGSFSGGIKVGNDYTPVSFVHSYIQGYDDIAPKRPWINFLLPDEGEPESVFLVENDGSLYATSVRVRFNDDIPVPDYVFEADYKLMPLKEVKQFVNENCHLPNIPSEEEFREEGLSIEEMQFKLLEKVEELTLYMIQLEEQNAAQQVEIEKLKEEIGN
ncbi:MAG: hypothetical protein QNK23_00505 [Crocinitomicaceae bacterium]|nr:hypothetical protein [Crocinitomicaceae bacterium]